MAAKKTRQLSAIEKIAVCKAFSDDKLKKDGTRDQLKPGCYLVDTVVRVHGTLKVAEDTEAFATYEPPLEAALLKLLRGCMEDAEILRALPRALRHAHDLGSDKQKKLLGETGIESCCDAFKAKVNLESGKLPKRGAVSATLLVDPTE